jgi:hypothetical protein
MIAVDSNISLMPTAKIRPGIPAADRALTGLAENAPSG